MIFKWVGRYSEPEKLLRLFRVVWERGRYSAKLTFGFCPIFDVHFERWKVRFLGLRLHYKRSCGGRFV